MSKKLKPGQQGDTKSTKPKHFKRESRSAENKLFEELSSLVPLQQGMKPDKLSTLRLVTSYMKCQHAVRVRENFPTGNLFALDMNPADYVSNKLDDIDYQLPETLVSYLHQHPLPGKESENEKEMTLESYKEALESGMKDFLASSVNESAKDDSQATNVENVIEQGTTNKLGGEMEKMFTQLDGDTDCDSPAGSPSYALEHKRNGGLMKKSTALREGWLMLKASQGLLLILDKALTITFVSENVLSLLGHQVPGMLGNTIDDYMYPDDAIELKRHLQDVLLHHKSEERDGSTKRIIHFAMKYCYSPLVGRMKESGYTLMQWTMNVRWKQHHKDNSKKLTGVVALCELMRPSIKQMSISCRVFCIHWTLDFKIVSGEFDKMQYLTGYTVDQYLKSLKYKYYPFPSSSDATEWMKSLLENGHHTTDFFRLKSLTGKWLWMQSELRLHYRDDSDSHEIETVTFIKSDEEVARYLKTRNNTMWQRAVCLRIPLGTSVRNGKTRALQSQYEVEALTGMFKQYKYSLNKSSQATATKINSASDSSCKDVQSLPPQSQSYVNPSPDVTSQENHFQNFSPQSYDLSHSFDDPKFVGIVSEEHAVQNNSSLNQPLEQQHAVMEFNLNASSSSQEVYSADNSSDLYSTIINPAPGFQDWVDFSDESSSNTYVASPVTSDEDILKNPSLPLDLDDLLLSDLLFFDQ